MRLLVLSSKTCWRSAASASGYATDGGFAFQMSALSELFDATTLALPCAPVPGKGGETALFGHNISIVPLTPRVGTGLLHKMAFPAWLARNTATILAELRRCDAVHTPIPGDVGTIGVATALATGKPLFVRHCGNWFKQVTPMEHVGRYVMERFAGGRNVMFATGGSDSHPSPRNAAIRWIFATALTERDLEACAVEREAPRESLRLVTVGRQVTEKGTGVVIETLPMLARDFPGVSLDVVGDGASLPEFKRLADRLGVGDRVRFHGKVDHDTVIRTLKAADLFCFPTWSSEGFPKVVLEALACGLPVVTTRVSVLPDLIGTGCGVVVETPAAPQVAEAVSACVADETVYREMSRVAVATARRYSLERWRDTIGDRLRAAWGPLRGEAPIGA